ncbi:agip45 [Agrotis ipsilon multiple nucleopolyhedrovirus]|uniref:Fibroblast growth factor n=1 Tax=Agrotis ipsilon multiple nucleopolyhedrovirus TaxID=208013 RepID=B6D5V9_9ABAC|nr:agip45 [Agrotis ipsilon multiple nucleopolyhedrovirus]ACI28747.1 fibroblast growth factor [Agrotis ipsilon multiple nucleopolyhedrovirus]
MSSTIPTTTAVLLLLAVSALSLTGEAATVPTLSMPLPLREGSQKHVHLYMNHWFLQMNGDGSINGSGTHESNQTLWHRIALGEGEVLLRSSEYCNYLCINECGYEYSAMVPNSECVWSEVYDTDHYRFVYKKFGNRTAYLSLNVLGKLKRVVLLKKETLGSSVEQCHVMVKEYEGGAFDKTCKPVSTNKLSYVPAKTCKNPPRPSRKNLKGKRNVSSVVDDDEEGGVEPIENSTVPPLDVKTKSKVGAAAAPLIVNKMGGIPLHEITNELPGLNNEVLYMETMKENNTINNTVESAIPKNFYYRDEESTLSIRTFKDSTSAKKVLLDKSELSDKAKESLGKVIEDLLKTGDSNGTSKMAFPIIVSKHTVSYKFCLGEI